MADVVTPDWLAFRPRLFPSCNFAWLAGLIHGGFARSEVLSYLLARRWVHDFAAGGPAAARWEHDRLISTVPHTPVLVASGWRPRLIPKGRLVGCRILQDDGIYAP
jgi:hypothetical protein